MPADWLPLQTDAFYRDANIDLRLATRVKSIDRATRHVTLENNDRLPFGALLLATGGEPIRLSIPGADGPRVHVLRSLVDAQAIVDRAKNVKRVALIGAGFIGLEVAASLRERGIDVEAVAPERVLFERVMGPALGAFLQRLHESHGVVFHLGATATKIDDRTVTLDSGKTIDADLILIGVGVRPGVALAEQAGLTIDRGIAVDEPRDQRAGHLRRRRHRALAPIGIRRSHPRRALGGRRTAGPGRGEEHARPTQAVPGRCRFWTKRTT